MQRWLGVLPPDQSHPRWHVSPLVDALAYHWSWLFVLVPMALSGNRFPAAYFGVWVVVSVITEVHRHVTVPYVYLDGPTLRARLARFTVVPAVLVLGVLLHLSVGKEVLRKGSLETADLFLFLGCLLAAIQWWWRDRNGVVWPTVQLLAMVLAPTLAAATLWMAVQGQAHDALGGAALVALAMVSWQLGGRGRWVVGGLALVGLLSLVVDPLAATKIPHRRIPMRWVVAGFGALAGGWTVWHVLMQKYGILRLYAAKSGPGPRTPGWADRWLVFGWLPLLMVTLPETAGRLIARHAVTAKAVLLPMTDWLAGAGRPLIGLAALAGVASLVHWGVREWQANRLQNRPRLSMALALTALWSAFFWLHPLKAYLAFAFSHALEYIVFVWAVQRRRNALLAKDDQPPTPLQRALTYPTLFWSVLLGGLGLLFLVGPFGQEMGIKRHIPKLRGITLERALIVWSLWQSFFHFYTDGFLWKMRRADTRRSV